MGARSRELFLLLAVCALALSEPIKKTVNKEAKTLNEFNEFDSDEQEILYSENRPCPRDCICIVSQGYRIAKCSRLDADIQKFGDDISDLVIENAKFPIQLEDFMFKKLGLHQIATVKIVNTTIEYVGPKAFHGLQELYAVNLSNNTLRSIHPDIFANNKKLLLLTLSNNHLKFPTADSQQYFLNASSVQELDISYCNMRTVTAHTFKNMPGIMYLNLAGNNLENLDPDTFKQLLDLEELDLSDNNIKTIPDDIFTENTELANLHIQRNPIDTVYGLQVSDLLTLNAGQTNIKFIGPSMFNGMVYLANLNLSGNGIEKIHNQAFHKLIELNYLDLSYNDLDFISTNLIKENIELDIFKISNNPRLKHLPAEGFNCSVEFNIYLFDASNCGLEEIYDDSLKTFTALSQINLSGNNIKFISAKVFANSPKLVDINLANNLITTLDAKVFEKNKELGKLNLHGNPIKVLLAEIFVPTPDLTMLDISYTELTSLWKVDKNHPTTLLNKLSYLNASNNHITEIKQTELDNLNKLRTLDITNNPLACSREFENLMTWLSKRMVSPNANTASIANLSKDSKVEVEDTYNWESLMHKTCGTAISHPVEPLPPVSDEEIWETIGNKEDVGDFDLKGTLDDPKQPDQPIDDSNDDNLIDDNDDDNDADDADDADDGEEDDEDEDEDDASDDFDAAEDEDIDLKVIDKSANTGEQIVKTQKVGTSKITLKLLDEEEDGNFEPTFYIEEAVKDADHGHYDYLWPILIAILCALLLLIVIAKVVMVVCSRRNQRVRYNSAIIAAMSNAGRTKKDCGLVYQQLSEELTGPATPKLSRYAPLPVKESNVSYECSTFHHNNIIPEAV